MAGPFGDCIMSKDVIKYPLNQKKGGGQDGTCDPEISRRPRRL